MLPSHEIEKPKEILIGVVSMLVGLIKAIAPDRFCESEGDYLTDLPAEQVKVKG